MPYQCNCGKIFDSPMERTAHVASCPTMTESKEYQEAVEIMAACISRKLESKFVLYPDARLWIIDIARELLAGTTYPCEKCNSTGAVSNYRRSSVYQGFVDKIPCPTCKGTGKGGKVLAVRAKNQVPVRLYDVRDEAVESFIEQAVQQDMLDHHWIKEVVKNEDVLPQR